jgi:hypothetical protein
MRLPRFNRGKHKHWVAGELDTSRLIRALWDAASIRQRRESEFLRLLVACSWTNVHHGDKGLDSTRSWRNRKIAEYLKVEYNSEANLASELSKRFPKLRNPAALLRHHTGFVAYYPVYRPATLRFITKYTDAIFATFSISASRKTVSIDKTRRVVDGLLRLGRIRGPRGSISPLNGLSATMACLDPKRRVPVINKRVEPILRNLGERADSHGAVVLGAWIDKNKVGVKHAFDLDVYANTTNFPSGPKLRPIGMIRNPREIGIKSELASAAKIAAATVKIRKRHNMLTNRFLKYVTGQYKIQEADFDLMLANWRPGRHLLIEAKTASAGPGGRAQLRQAIGQLFDYRFTYLPPSSRIDLAVLLPSKPADGVIKLLASLKIKTLWFKGKRLEGTITL